MVNKEPKTDKGKARKMLGGDGRRKTPGEEYVISQVRIERAVKKTMNAAAKAAEGVTFGSKKKKQAKGKKR
jgi:hypothetical protein